jgi:hypothetical protein
MRPSPLRASRQTFPNHGERGQGEHDPSVVEPRARARHRPAAHIGFRHRRRCTSQTGPRYHQGTTSNPQFPTPEELVVTPQDSLWGVGSWRSWKLGLVRNA